MIILIIAWAMIGLIHWTHWVSCYYQPPGTFFLNLFIALPMFLILGPVTSIRKIIGR